MMAHPAVVAARGETYLLALASCHYELAARPA
jgi:hypothetical protein